MSQHISVAPLTPAQRLAYAQACRTLAVQMRQRGDLYSAEVNEWIADNYTTPPLNRSPHQ
jgi:hypothetical protein